jgi:2-iminobutanoate/2-iminopropanoate deaminase
MRRPISSAFVGALVALLATPALAAAQTADRVPVIPEGQRASPTLTPGIRSGNIVYASGQLGNSRADSAPTIQSETRRALENTKRVFEAAGTTMANAIRCTVFLVDVKDFAGMNEAYREFFPTSPPARSTVVVAALVVPNAKVEIECMAAIPPK